MLSPVRRLLKVFHPEGIPWPGTGFYNIISKSNIFQKSYELVARDILNYCSEGSILDVGTGPGWLLIKLQQMSPGLRLTGVDTSAAMIAKAEENIVKARFSHTITLKEGRADRMPFPEESFDLVVSTGSLHHWKDPTAGLNEVYRVLKKGCYALMYDLVSDTPSSVLKEGARQFSRLRMTLLWLHSFEEPFYSAESFRLLSKPTLFGEGQVRFVGLLCCLVLEKPCRNEIFH